MKILECAVAMIVLTACSLPSALATPVLTGEAKIRQEATAFVNLHRDKYVIKCGDYYFMRFVRFSTIPPDPIVTVQGKDLTLESEGDYYRAQDLTQADILNKATPYPASFLGRVKIKFSVAREASVRGQVTSRTLWMNNYSTEFQLRFYSDGWSIRTDFLPIDCAEAEAAF